MQEFWQIIGITIERIIILFATLAKYVWHYIKHQLYNGHGVSVLTGMLTWEYFIQPPVSFEIEICTHFCGFSISLGLFVCLEFWLFCFSILTGFVYLSIKWFSSFLLFIYKIVKIHIIQCIASYLYYFVLQWPIPLT